MMVVVVVVVEVTLAEELKENDKGRCKAGIWLDQRHIFQTCSSEVIKALLELSLQH